MNEDKINKDWEMAFGGSSRMEKIVAFVCILLIVGFAWFLSWDAKEATRREKMDYAECILSTPDREWCFKQVFGIDVKF